MRNRIKQFTRERVEQLRQEWHKEHGASTPADTEALYAQAQPGMIMVDYLQLRMAVILLRVAFKKFRKYPVN